MTHRMSDRRRFRHQSTRAPGWTNGIDTKSSPFAGKFGPALKADIYCRELQRSLSRLGFKVKHSVLSEPFRPAGCSESGIWRLVAMNKVATVSWWSVAVLIGIVVIALLLVSR
jgi:hypothetical protein